MTSAHKCPLPQGWMSNMGLNPSHGLKRPIFRISATRRTPSRNVLIWSSVDMLQQAADQAKTETAGLQTGVVHLTEENSRLRSERDNAVQVRERAMAYMTWLWQRVDRLGGDSPLRGNQGMGSGIPRMFLGSPCETEKVIPSPKSKGSERISSITCMKYAAPPPPPRQCYREKGGAQCFMYRQFTAMAVTSFGDGKRARASLGSC